jgi:hypothetical protein
LDISEGYISVEDFLRRIFLRSIFLRDIFLRMILQMLLRGTLKWIFQRRKNGTLTVISAM